MVKSDSMGYVGLEVTYKDGESEEFISVRQETIEIDDLGCLRFDRVRHGDKPVKLGSVLIPVKNIKKFEVIEGK